MEDERAYSVSGAFLGFLDVSDLGRDCGKCRGYRCGRWSRADARCRPSGVSFVVCESETRTFQTLAGRRFDVEWLALCLRLPSVLARYMCASFPYHARGSSASVARCLSHFGVFAIFFPHSARPGAWWPNARSSGFARLAFSGRLSSFAALPNEGASNRLEWAECYVR